MPDSAAADCAQNRSREVAAQLRSASAPDNGGQRGFLTRNPHPFEGRSGRRWSGLQRVVSDFGRGPSTQAPGRRHSTLRWHEGLTCSDASPSRPRTANPGEKTSLRLSAVLTCRYAGQRRARGSKLSADCRSCPTNMPTLWTYTARRTAEGPTPHAAWTTAVLNHSGRPPRSAGGPRSWSGDAVRLQQVGRGGVPRRPRGACGQRSTSPPAGERSSRSPWPGTGSPHHPKAGRQCPRRRRCRVYAR